MKKSRNSAQLKPGKIALKRVRIALCAIAFVLSAALIVTGLIGYSYSGNLYSLDGILLEDVYSNHAPAEGRQYTDKELEKLMLISLALEEVSAKNPTMKDFVYNYLPLADRYEADPSFSAVSDRDAFLTSDGFSNFAAIDHMLGSVSYDTPYIRAMLHALTIETHETSYAKTAPSAVKKAEIAVKDTASAVKTASAAVSEAVSVHEGYLAGSVSDSLIDALSRSAHDISEGVSVLEEALGVSAQEDATAGEALQSALTSISESGKAVEDAAYSLVYALVEDEFSKSLKAVNNAETKLINAIAGVADVYERSDLSWTYEPVVKTSMKAEPVIEGVLGQLDALHARAQALSLIADDMTAQAAQCFLAAGEVTHADSTPFGESLVLSVGNKSIFIFLTGVILLIIAMIAFFIPASFMRAWKNTPTFSTFITALVMVVILTYAHGNTVDFHFSSFSEWGGKWLSLVLDVLRSNAFIGMVALGMTFVIITGGIDLAVGSTLAGIATVVMVILDVSQNGVFTAAGLTGVPNYIVAITAGVITGMGLGALTGLIITKGHVPPFIVTLGIMNIVRSVAQYFTKSIKISVPKEFQAIANEPLGEYILLPIIYWLILAVIMYVISKHTAFGRHIYAVGSNERTSRLSGINVDRVKISVYMLMGFIVAIAAVTQVARLGAVDVASAGSGLEMSAIAAVVVGGTSMAGGRGSIVGTILGVLIIGIMDKLVILLHIDAFLSNAFIGAIIIFAVLMQRKDK